MDSIKPSLSATGNRQKSISSTRQLEFHIASVYQEISEMLQSKPDLQIEMPADVPTAVERVNLIKSVLFYLLEQRSSNCKQTMNIKESEKDDEENNIFDCKNCENYEKNLQKLEGEIRNHIRTHQQLKLYQDGLEEKIEENKKDKKQIEKKYESLKKKYEEIKTSASMTTERISKYETQNQQLKIELKQFRSGSKINEETNHKRLNRYQSNKENLSDWRNQAPKERPSVERRGQSSQRMRISVNVKSSKGIPLSTKIIQDKAAREEPKDKQKIKSRIGFGY